MFTSQSDFLFADSNQSMGPSSIPISSLDLPQQYTNPVDLIIDALLGYQFTLRDLTDDGENPRRLVSDLMDWANANKAPVLSLDFPSGVNGATGEFAGKG